MDYWTAFRARLKTTPATLLIMSVCTAVSIYFLLRGITFFKPEHNLEVLHLGGNFAAFTLDGQWWRLFSSLFIHFGFVHLAFNLYSLYFLGELVERKMGFWMFLFLFFSFGLAGNVASLYYNLFIVSAGASGAIFGLYGFVITTNIITSVRQKESINAILVNFAIFALVNTLIGMSGIVDNAAHLGGFFMGVLAALYFFYLPIYSKYFQELFIIISISFICLLYIKLPHFQVHYYRAFQQLLDLEEFSQEHVNGVKSDEERLKMIVEVLPKWDSLMYQFKLLDLPREELQVDRKILIQYSDLTKGIFEFQKIGIEKESYIYLDSMEHCQTLIRLMPAPKYILIYDKPEPRTPPEKPDNDLIPKREFYDSLWLVTDSLEAVYFRLGAVDSLGRWQGKVIDYFADGRPQMKGSYKNDLKEGVFIYYSDHYTYTSAGVFSSELPVGKWEYFHDQGQLKSEVYYSPNGIYLKNFWTPDGQQTVSDGYGSALEYHPNGELASVVRVIDGKKEGHLRGFNENGKLFYQEEYVNNRMVSGKSVDEQGNRYNYDIGSYSPNPIGGWDHYHQYLRDSIRTGRDMMGGEVEALVEVLPSGEISSIALLKITNDQLYTEIKRLIHDGPRWVSGLEYGYKPTRSTALVRVKF